jgi:uncharacterized protein
MMGYEMAGAEAAPGVPAQAAGEDFYELGLMYAAGRAVPADFVEAHKWFNIAVARGCREAVVKRAELAHEMSAEEIAAAQRQARLWLTQH